jgi:hypothetical protein
MEEEIPGTYRLEFEEVCTKIIANKSHTVIILVDCNSSGRLRFLISLHMIDDLLCLHVSDLELEEVDAVHICIQWT